jgi:hypothetical protein
MGQRLGRKHDPALRSQDREIESFTVRDRYAKVRQLACRKGEVCGA